MKNYLKVIYFVGERTQRNQVSTTTEEVPNCSIVTAATPSLAVSCNTDGQSSEEISGLWIYIEKNWKAA